jgi:hypothetical protein
MAKPKGDARKNCAREPDNDTAWGPRAKPDAGQPFDPSQCLPLGDA